MFGGNQYIFNKTTERLDEKLGTSGGELKKSLTGCGVVVTMVLATKHVQFRSEN